MNIALYTQFVCDAVNEKDKGAGLFFILQIIITASSALFLCRLWGESAAVCAGIMSFMNTAEICLLWVWQIEQEL